MLLLRQTCQNRNHSAPVSYWGTEANTMRESLHDFLTDKSALVFGNHHPQVISKNIWGSVKAIVIGQQTHKETAKLLLTRSSEFTAQHKRSSNGPAHRVGRNTIIIAQGVQELVYPKKHFSFKKPQLPIMLQYWYPSIASIIKFIPSHAGILVWLIVSNLIF